MDPDYLEAIMKQLVAAFPDHTVTLALRCPGDARCDAVATSDSEPARPAAMLGKYVLKNHCPQEMAH